MNIRQHKFVTEYLRFGDHAIAYKNAYNSTATGKVIESAANRLMKNPEVAKTIEDAQTTIRERVEKEVAEQLKGELLTIQRKRELLYQIATGEMHVLQYHKGKDCNTCSQYVTPTINHMLRAIHLDNKLAGHYPAQQHTYVTAACPDRMAGRNEAASRKHVSPARHAELDSVSSEPQGKTVKIHNNSQQTTVCLNPEDKSKDKMNLSKTQQTLRNKSPLQGDRGRLAQENTEHDLSPAAACPANGGRGVRLSADGGGALAQEKQTMKKHNKTQQFKSPLQGDRGKTITQTQLNNLLNTDLNHEEIPRILQFRRHKELTE